MSKKEKILVIGQHFWPEGFRINDICDYFIENDMDVEVLCGIPNYPTGTFFPGYSLRGPYKEVHNGVVIHRAAEIKRGNNSNIRIFLNYLSFPVSSMLHLPRLMFGRYDRIFLYQLSPVMMSLVGIVLGKIRNIDTTMYVLDLWPENLFSVLNVRNVRIRRFLEIISHWHYRRVDKIVVLSDLMREKLATISGLSTDKIIVVPQACETLYENEIFDAGLQERLSAGFNIVFTGNLSPAQSFETILDAAEELYREGLHDIRWIIVGDGMSRQSIEADVERRGLSEVFSFEGQYPVADMPKYTTLADVLVGCLVKSDLLEATIPAKVLSYIATGKPLVLAMDGEVKRLVSEQAQCGLVGPAGDAAALKRNVRALYSMSQAERDAMGARGRSFHFKHLERNIVLKKLKSFITETN